MRMQATFDDFQNFKHAKFALFTTRTSALSPLPHPPTKHLNMADEVYDGAIGIDLGMEPDSHPRSVNHIAYTALRHDLFVRCQL